MYQILGKLTEINAPLVFKGALITRLILLENGYTKTERQTNDIDANWVDTPPTMDELTKTINRSLESFNGSIYAVAKRQYGHGRSAGIWVMSRDTDEQIFSMDITIKPVIGSRVYHYGEASINGVIPEAVLCDKISVLSNERIFRRVKDLIDIYALSNCLKIKLVDIYKALGKANRPLNSFESFTTRRSDIEHAYNKLRGVIGKPDFDSVYSYLKKFLEPFIQHDISNKEWDSGSVLWRIIIEG
jgi:hypothetical protein